MGCFKYTNMLDLCLLHLMESLNINKLYVLYLMECFKMHEHTCCRWWDVLNKYVVSDGTHPSKLSLFRLDFVRFMDSQPCASVLQLSAALRRPHKKAPGLPSMSYGCGQLSLILGLPKPFVTPSLRRSCLPRFGSLNKKTRPGISGACLLWI